MRKAGVALACSVLLGCASASGVMLSEDVAIVSAKGSGPGNGSDDRETIIRNALAEAARLTRAHGYRYFVVLTADDTTTTTTRKSSGLVLYYQAPDRGAGTIYGNYRAPYVAPDRTVERTWPAFDITIRMYREGEIDPSMDGVWAAAE